jgi:hypothetical protein
MVTTQMTGSKWHYIPLSKSFFAYFRANESGADARKSRTAPLGVTIGRTMESRSFKSVISGEISPWTAKIFPDFRRNRKNEK